MSSSDEIFMFYFCKLYEQNIIVLRTRIKNTLFDRKILL